MAPLLRRAAPLVQSTPAFLLRRYCLGSEATSTDLHLFRQAIAQVSPAVLAHRLSIVGTRHSFGRNTFDVPCRYLQAAGDRLVPATAPRWFEQRFTNLKVERVDGPHFLLQTRPAESAAWLRACL